ncbi:MAG: ThiF family adenylyltransferase [Rhodospirillales bacterium]|nr:ThiF family adenylyltransferase [Rhodospirillales bacterium]
MGSGPFAGRYVRQELFGGIGRAGQEKLARSTAVVLGCGALGTVSAAALARAGVGHLRVVDRDFIEPHNLQRQLLYDEEDVAQQLPKAVAAQQHLARANSSIQVEAVVADVSHRNVESLVEGADVLIDGLDNLETRYLLNDVALTRRVPWVYGAAVASYGMTRTIVPGRTACLRCLFPELPTGQRAATCDTAGVVNAAPMAIAALQAAEALKLLVGADPAPSLRQLDVWAGTLQALKLSGPELDCPACQGRYDFLEGRGGSKVTTLCGQDAVQVVPATQATASLDELAAKLRPLGAVVVGPHLLRFKAEGREMVLFPDLRAIIKGAADESAARSFYARFVGM